MIYDNIKKRKYEYDQDNQSDNQECDTKRIKIVHDKIDDKINENTTLGEAINNPHVRLLFFLFGQVINKMISNVNEKA